VVDRIETLLEGKQGLLRPHTRIHLHTMLGVANYCLGNFIAAWDQFEAARLLDLEWPCTPENPIAGGDPATVIRNYLGRTGCVLGRIEESLVFTEEGLAFARRRADAFSLAWALYGRACALRVAGRYEEGMSDANEAVGLCERHGFQARLGSVLMARGTLLVGLGDGERGLQDMYSGADMWHQTSGNFHMSEWLSYLVDFLWRLDRLAEADTVLCKAEQIIEGTDEKSHLGEILRLRGNLLHCNGTIDRAETCLVKAIEWSRQREAKVFELRARRDLARIYIRDGKADAASALLKGGLSLSSPKIWPSLICRSPTNCCIICRGRSLRPALSLPPVERPGAFPQDSLPGNTRHHRAPADTSLLAKPPTAVIHSGTWRNEPAALPLPHRVRKRAGLAQGPMLIAASGGTGKPIASDRAIAVITTIAAPRTKRKSGASSV
jgi:tetratricopeptide (TPR) repeat protein